ncbi:hypothetical protein [Halapricum desulfuricans]|uniref:Putative membrane protein n=1 Tax=Halapricum desulfuricans TaxID=2841257 RepID=A0A897NCB0_9EURY|nr:hypothetical protein [Halapricum desulfuricans]QSG10098.1 putative membrane protein [Halapricum desulfuricans]
MAERTDQLSRDDEVGDVDLDAIMNEQADTTDESDTSGGIRGRIGRRVGSVFSIRTFGLALVLTIGLAFVVSAVVPFVPDNLTGLVGVFLGGGAIGLASDARRYLEVGAAALMAGALTVLLSNFTIAVFGPGVPLVALGAGSSGVAGLLGHYVGRDLRAGLTREIE